MATDSSKSSVWSTTLVASLVVLAGVAAFLLVNGSSLPSAEENTLAQAQGPVPPPARLPTPTEPIQQAPVETQQVQQVDQQPVEQNEPETAQQVQQEEYSEYTPQQQRSEPSQPVVTRLTPAAPSQERASSVQQEQSYRPEPNGTCDDPEYAAQYC